MLHQLCNGRKGDAEALKIILENCENHILDVNLETDSKVNFYLFSLFSFYLPHFDILRTGQTYSFYFGL